MADKGNRGAIVFVIILFIIVILIALVKHDWDNDVEKPKGDYVALITHSERQDNENGIEYTYYIYNSKKSYIYIKTKTIVTKEGAKKEEEVDSGRIKSKKDMNIIKEDIEKDTVDGNIKYVYYVYNNRGTYINYENYNKLIDVLW